MTTFDENREILHRDIARWDAEGPAGAGIPQSDTTAARAVCFLFLLSIVLLLGAAIVTVAG